MIDGIGHDDRYRMVEDEFLDVAKEFTRHLHAAEYQRLKNLAVQSQSAGNAIQNISRPVVPGSQMSDLVRRRQAATELAAKQRGALKKKPRARDADDDDSEDEDGVTMAASLRGLMDSPRKKAVPLTALGVGGGGGSNVARADLLSPSRRGRRPDVGAGLGLGARPESATTGSDEDDDDDDALDGQSTWSPRFGTRQFAPTSDNTRSPSRLSSSMRPPPKPTETRTLTSRSVTFKIEELSETETARPAETLASAQEEDDDNDFFTRIRSRRSGIRRWRQQQQQTEVKTEDQLESNVRIKTSESQNISLDEIPFI